MTTAIEPQAAPSCRLAEPTESDAGPAIELVDGTWHVRALPLVREVLRSRDGYRQSGFNAEAPGMSRQQMRPPILYADGEAHRAQRSAIARFFTPRTVDDRYRQMMSELADELVAGVMRSGAADFSRVTMRFSVQVAAQVIGLTESDYGAMARRLEALFGSELYDPEREPSKLALVKTLLRARRPVMRFYNLDVLPAIAVRRERHAAAGDTAPADSSVDVISHLIEQGYSDLEILTECLTYGAAGMITTREFLQVALWHLLRDPSLRASYLDGDLAHRGAVLAELLRLEPVVGHLYRRAQETITLTHEGVVHTIAKGARLNLYVRSANFDTAQFGADAGDVCPARPTPTAVRAEGMSFGDGAHRCPGNAIALQESEVLLTALLQHEVNLISGPDVAWDPMTQGYELRRFMISVVDRRRLPAEVEAMINRPGS